MAKDREFAHKDAVRILETTLRDDSRPLAILLGAGGGCSIEEAGVPLIPAIAGLTDMVRAEVGAKSKTLSALEATFVADGNSQSTIEDWLSRLRTLITIAGSESVRGMDAAGILEAEKMIVNSVARIVAKDLPKENMGGYGDLAAWAAGFDRSHALEIFTLSYDLLVEQALERSKVAYFDGFLGSFEPFLDLRTMEEDSLPTRWARLWKMHGSINWKLKNNLAFRSAISSDTNFDDALIHPSHLKYDQSRRMPYLAMQDRLRAFMKQPGAALITVGYSFGDQHINELIEEGLRINPGSVCFGLIYENLDKSQAASEAAVRSLNLRLYCADGAVLGGKSGEWLTDDKKKALTNYGDFNELGLLLRRITSNSR
jgi:hypothetical protein